VENVLGEIGRGHIIAFNILNLGRLKLGPFATVGGQGSAGGFAEVRQGAQGVRKIDRRVRHDPAQAGGDGHPHLRGGDDQYRVVGLIEIELENFSWSQANARKPC
jgi:hypothetical protein